MNALEALLNADDGAPERQLHGVDADGTFAFSGEECMDWFGHREDDHVTVAGNLLTGEAVIDATADTYAETAVHETTDPATGPNAATDDTEVEPLAKRLIDALAAGHDEGGDKREDLTVQSAAVAVASSESHEMTPAYNDLRLMRPRHQSPICGKRTILRWTATGRRSRATKTPTRTIRWLKPPKLNRKHAATDAKAT